MTDLFLLVLTLAFAGSSIRSIVREATELRRIKARLVVLESARARHDAAIGYLSDLGRP